MSSQVAHGADAAGPQTSLGVVRPGGPSKALELEGLDSSPGSSVYYALG